MQYDKGKHTLSTVDLTLHSSFLICHILINFIVFVSLCPQTGTPLSLSEHPSASRPPSLSLTFCSLACPCSPSTFLPPSFFPSLSPPPPLPSSSSCCALDSLSFPLAHTLRQHPPISTYFPLTSPLLLPPSSPSPTDTYHLWHLPVYCLPLPPFSPPFLPPSLYSLTHSTLLPRANSRVHTLMLIGTQGQSTLSPVPVTRRFARVARLLDTELS